MPPDLMLGCATIDGTAAQQLADLPRVLRSAVVCLPERHVLGMSIDRKVALALATKLDRADEIAALRDDLDRQIAEARALHARIRVELTCSAIAALIGIAALLTGWGMVW